MTNFLNRLAARTLGTAPLAQPVVPAVFTPAPADMGVQAQTDVTQSARPDTEPSAAPSQIAAPQHRSASPAVVEPARKIQTASADVPQATHVLPATPVPAPSARTLAAESEIAPLRVSPQPQVSFPEQPQAEVVKETRKTVIETSQRVISQTRTIAVAAQQRSDPFIPITTIDSPAMPSTRPKTFANSIPQQPVIKVTIGRDRK